MEVFKKSIVLYIIFFFFALAPASAEEFQPDRLIDNQEWQVAISYPSALEDGSWSDPEVWRYRAKKSESGWVISGAPENAKDGSERIEILTDESSKVREVLIYHEAGKTARERIIRPGDGVPVLTERSRAPFDMPVFPLDVPSKKSYRKIVTLGSGLQAETTVIQTVSRVNADTPSGVPDDASQREGVIEVTLSDDRGTVLVGQYWIEGHPWPLSGYNRSMRYRLVTNGE